MRATILWRPLGGDKYLNCSTPSKFRKIMEEIYGSFPITLNQNDIGKLNAMAKVDHRPNEENPYAQLVDILEYTESIEIDTQYEI